MESLVMVACTVSITVGYPMTDIAAIALTATVSDTSRNWNKSTRTLEDHDSNRESIETDTVDLDSETLKMGKKSNYSEQIELTTYATNAFKTVNDMTESFGPKLGHRLNSEFNIGQVDAQQDFVSTRMNQKYVTALNLETSARHATHLSFQSIKSETDTDSIGPPETSRYVTAVDLELAKTERLYIEQSETEERSGQPEVTFVVDFEDLTSSVIFPDDKSSSSSSSSSDRSFETMTSSGKAEVEGAYLKQSDKEAESDAVDMFQSTHGIAYSDLEINQTQSEVDQSEYKANKTETEVSKTGPEVNCTEPKVDNSTFNDTESMLSVETTLEQEKDSKGVSVPSGGEEEGSSAVSTFKFPVSNESIYVRLNTLVSALEQLGVLDSVGQCYSVERITKSLQAGSSALLKIELFLETRRQTSTSTLHEDHDNDDDVIGPGNETDLTSGGYSGEEEDCFVNGTDVRGRKIAGNKCIPLMETNPGNRTEDGTLNGTHWSSMNLTDLRRNSASKSSTEHHSDNGALKPSRTQILVISTCSTVIGLFFIVALIMRIRNHLKRTRTLNKHRNGLRPHSRQHIASALTNDPTALALPPRTPPIDCDKKEVIVKQKGFSRAWTEEDEKETTYHPRGHRRSLFGGSRSNSSNNVSKDHSCSSRSASVVPPKMPQLRRQSELSRFFISQKSQRETAKEYIRQLSLSQATPSNALFVGTSFHDEPPSPPHDASRKLLPMSREIFQRLDMA